MRRRSHPAAGWRPRPPSPAVRERGFFDRVHCWVFVLTAVLLIASFAPAHAACTGVVAGDGTRLWRAAASEGTVSITFLGHASFLIESPGGVRAVTDYNDLIRAPTTPDIVTMNVAHTTHWTDHIEPGVKFVLRGRT